MRPLAPARRSRCARDEGGGRRWLLRRSPRDHCWPALSSTSPLQRPPSPRAAWERQVGERHPSRSRATRRSCFPDHIRAWCSARAKSWSFRSLSSRRNARSWAIRQHTSGLRERQYQQQLSGRPQHRHEYLRRAGALPRPQRPLLGSKPGFVTPGATFREGIHKIAVSRAEVGKQNSSLGAAVV